MQSKRLLGAIKRANYPTNLDNFGINSILRSIRELGKLGDSSDWNRLQILIGLIHNDSRFKVAQIDQSARVIKHKIGTPFERSIVIPNRKGIIITNSESDTIWFVGFVANVATIEKIG